MYDILCCTGIGNQMGHIGNQLGHIGNQIHTSKMIFTNIHYLINYIHLAMLHGTAGSNSCPFQTLNTKIFSNLQLVLQCLLLFLLNNQ